MLVVILAPMVLWWSELKVWGLGARVRYGAGLGLEVLGLCLLSLNVWSWEFMRLQARNRSEVRFRPSGFHTILGKDLGFRQAATGLENIFATGLEIEPGVPRLFNTGFQWCS